MVTKSEYDVFIWAEMVVFMSNRLTAKISSYNFELVGLLKDHYEKLVL
jgi:hypothetical protein